ncbi:DNA-processing protein DprA [Coprobacter tertius]|uniref:DNA-processing protein DprA n=1 Tax=Coprobacter tertius TaxID=2944915 RepID=A0ABT1MG71_9BACT|nr:DNA-processing protein DprA [Coprobacter tertius]MCP9611635.1 DNA-processing protein DprA [Coprobacter tertius]
MNCNNDLIYKIALTRIKGMNMLMARLLLESFGEVREIFSCKQDILQKVSGLQSPVFADDKRQKAKEQALKEAEFIEKNKITPLFFTDPDYPSRLLECVDAPLMLYYRGNADLNVSRIISIVGTRHATNYGRGFCTEFINDLSQIFPESIIVSGLAYGIDIAAHRAALQAGLQTIGVLAHGLNTLYPPVHRQTAIEMLSHGGLLTEYISQQLLHRGNFIARNRIVAGLSDATVIVESAEKGGALITAGIASGYSRDVFALPGRIGDTYSKGCNRLIACNQAALITSAEDFIDAMCWERPLKKEIQPSLFSEVNEQEETILKILQDKGECQIEQLTIFTDRPAPEILASLLELEFKGLIQAYPGGVYRRVK